MKQMTNAITNNQARPSISFPTLLSDEIRSVTAPYHSESLVSFTTLEGYSDLLRMTETSTSDLIIYPEWSDGTETYWVLAAGESIEVRERSSGTHPGLKVCIKSGAVVQSGKVSPGKSELVEITGYLRIGRNAAAEARR